MNATFPVESPVVFFASSKNARGSPRRVNVRGCRQKNMAVLKWIGLFRRGNAWVLS